MLAVGEINLAPVNGTRPEILRRYVGNRGGSDIQISPREAVPERSETSTLDVTPRIRNASVGADRFLGSDILPELMGEPATRHALK